MTARKRLNELEGRTAECRSLISDLKEYIKEAEMEIEELQSSIWLHLLYLLTTSVTNEEWKESIGIIENLVREYESVKELLEEEAYNERQREIVEENIAWRMMKL